MSEYITKRNGRDLCVYKKWKDKDGNERETNVETYFCFFPESFGHELEEINHKINKGFGRLWELEQKIYNLEKKIKL